jgi:hypothetical protein
LIDLVWLMWLNRAKIARQTAYVHLASRNWKFTKLLPQTVKLKINRRLLLQNFSICRFQRCIFIYFEAYSWCSYFYVYYNIINIIIVNIIIMIIIIVIRIIIAIIIIYPCSSYYIYLSSPSFSLLSSSSP